MRLKKAEKEKGDLKTSSKRLLAKIDTLKEDIDRFNDEAKKVGTDV